MTLPSIRKPPGLALPRNDAELIALSSVSPTDIELARAQVSGTALGALLESKLYEEPPVAPPL